MTTTGELGAPHFTRSHTRNCSKYLDHFKLNCMTDRRKVFWGIALWFFREMHCLHLLDWSVSQPKLAVWICLFLNWLKFDLEDGSVVYLKISGCYQTTWCYNTENSTLHSHHLQNLKSNMYHWSFTKTSLNYYVYIHALDEASGTMSNLITTPTPGVIITLVFLRTCPVNRNKLPFRKWVYICIHIHDIYICRTCLYLQFNYIFSLWLAAIWHRLCNFIKCKFLWEKSAGKRAIHTDLIMYKVSI
jgi:hypothetical protein